MIWPFLFSRKESFKFSAMIDVFFGVVGNHDLAVSFLAQGILQVFSYDRRFFFGGGLKSRFDCFFFSRMESFKFSTMIDFFEAAPAPLGGQGAKSMQQNQLKTDRSSPPRGEGVKIGLSGTCKYFIGLRKFRITNESLELLRRSYQIRKSSFVTI